MRICLVAFGSRGDYQPFVALGLALTAAGHQVAITTTREGAELVDRWGLATVPIDFSLHDLSPQHSEFMAGWGSGNLLRQRHILHRLMSAVARPLARTVRQVMDDDYDLYLGGVLTTLPLLGVQQHAGRHGPRVGFVGFAPSWPHRDADSTMLAVRPGSSPLNLLAGSITTAVWATTFRPLTRAVQHELGVTATDLIRGLAAVRSTHTILAVSPTVCPPATYPGSGRVDVTGFLHLDGRSPDRLSGGTTDFLDAADPPVYLGFGSASLPMLRARAAQVVAAVRARGQRVVVEASLGVEPDDDVLPVTGEPHDLLFPRCAAVVHHGGSGTTGTALRSGRPQWVIPLAADQPYFARRVHELGAAAAPVQFSQVTSRRATAALEACQAPGIRRRAAGLGEVIRAEPSWERAVSAVEALAAL